MVHNVTKPTWSVFAKEYIADKISYKHVKDVEATTAGDACDWICRTHWISRTQLEAFPKGERAEKFTVER